MSMKCLNVVTKSLAKGNQIAALIDSDVGGSKTFGESRGLRLKAIGDTQNVVVAWATQVSVGTGVVAVVNEFNGTGPYPLLNARGISETQVADFKAHVIASVVDWSEPRHASLMSLVERLGYEVVNTGTV